MVQAGENRLPAYRFFYELSLVTMGQPGLESFVPGIFNKDGIRLKNYGSSSSGRVFPDKMSGCVFVPETQGSKPCRSKEPGIFGRITINL